jgi:hypothetical protein
MNLHTITPAIPEDVVHALRYYRATFPRYTFEFQPDRPVRPVRYRTSPLDIWIDLNTDDIRRAARASNRPHGADR